MIKNNIQNIIIHTSKDTNSHVLADKINEFHVEVIKRRLNRSDLTTKQKIIVIDKIIEDLKLREVSGIIE